MGYLLFYHANPLMIQVLRGICFSLSVCVCANETDKLRKRMFTSNKTNLEAKPTPWIYCQLPEQPSEVLQCVLSLWKRPQLPWWLQQLGRWYVSTYPRDELRPGFPSGTSPRAWHCLCRLSFFRKCILLPLQTNNTHERKRGWFIGQSRMSCSDTCAVIVGLSEVGRGQRGVFWQFVLQYLFCVIQPHW